MRRESARFSSGVCLAMAWSVSRSIPEQKAFPAPVRITTRTALSASAAFSAAKSSSIIGVEIALRFSGRFKVIIATRPSRSNFRVLYSKVTSVSVYRRRSHGIDRFWLVAVFFAQLVGHRASNGKRLGVNASGNAASCERGQNCFAGNIPHQLVSRERASAQPRQRAIEASASRFIRRQNFFRSVLWTAVQVNSNFNSRYGIFRRVVKASHVFGRCRANGVCQRNNSYAGIFQPHQRFFHNFRAPWLVVGISKSHGNIRSEERRVGK